MEAHTAEQAGDEYPQEGRTMRVTIIGCGNGAFAAAADLTSRGHEITVYANETHKRHFEPIKDNVVSLTNEGKTCDVKIHKFTCDIEDALADAEVIMPIIPANAHESIALEIAPHLKDDDRIMLVPGSTGGALVFAKILAEHSDARWLRISEMHTLPYACRKEGPAKVKILLNVRRLFFACFPSIYNEEMFSIAEELYPACELVNDVLETSLNNGNATTHPAPVVLSAAKIERGMAEGKPHYHYEEGITPSVANVIQAIDDERKAICGALGYDELDVKDRLFDMGYTSDKSSVYAAIRSSKDSFLPLEGPNNLDGRYLTEDTPFSLVAMSEIAKIKGVATPMMDAIVNIANALKSENYWASGRTLEKMGLDGMSFEQIKHYLETGEK